MSYYKLFTNRVTLSVFENTKPSHLCMARACEKIALPISSPEGPSNPVSNMLLLKQGFDFPI